MNAGACNHDLYGEEYLLCDLKEMAVSVGARPPDSFTSKDQNEDSPAEGHNISFDWLVTPRQLWYSVFLFLGGVASIRILSLLSNAFLLLVSLLGTTYLQKTTVIPIRLHHGRSFAFLCLLLDFEATVTVHMRAHRLCRDS